MLVLPSPVLEPLPALPIEDVELPEWAGFAPAVPMPEDRDPVPPEPDA